MDLGKMVDVAISLSMMFLMLSLFCTIINEIIASRILGLRSRTLKAGLAQLAGDCPEFWAVLGHPLIKGAGPDVARLAAKLNQAQAAAKGVGTGVVQLRAALDQAAARLKAQEGGDAVAFAEARQAFDAAKAAWAASSLTARLGTLPEIRSYVEKEQQWVAFIAARSKPIRMAINVSAAIIQPVVSLWRTIASPQAPSYVSGRIFASAVLDKLNPNIQFNDTGTYRAVMNAIDALPPTRLQEVLRATANNTAADLQSVRDSVAHWFDGEMEHAEALYKKYLQAISFAVGLGLAMILNADTIHVAKVLWQDHTLAARIADGAGKLLEDKQAVALVEADKAAANALAAYSVAQQKKAAAQDKLDKEGNAATADVKAGLQRDLDAAIAATEAAKTAHDAAKAARSDIILKSGANVSALKESLSPLPVGWADRSSVLCWLKGWVPWPVDACAAGPGLGAAWLQLAGWFLTALALTLGAPFWFDTLGKVVNIRSAGTKPATTSQLQQAEQGK